MWTRRKFVGAVGAAGTLAAVSGCQDALPPRAAGSRGKPGRLPASSLDRKAIVDRHAPSVSAIDPKAVFSVGNGNFAFNVDATGLQTLNDTFSTIPTTTMAHWAWHSLPMPAGMDPAAFRYQMFNTYGREVPYPTSETGQKDLFNYLRQNPHMIHLGRIGLFADNQPIAAERIKNIQQRVDLWRGIITSAFTLDGVPVKVMTAVHPEQDVVALRIECAKAADLKLQVLLAFPYGSPDMSAADWTSPTKHQTHVVSSDAGLMRLERVMDTTRYWVRIAFAAGRGEVRSAPQQFLVPIAQGDFEISVSFDQTQQLGPLPPVAQTFAAVEKHWEEFWSTGAAIDLGQCTDARAPELERRIVLSQYLTAIHCAGELPSAETGLLVNSWYGKFHLEMHFWHSAHFTMWDRFPKFARTLPLYFRILPIAQAWAKKQGYAGARWPKMIGPDGHDSPSPVGPLLIWQQPHLIYYAWLCYRQSPTKETLARWSEIVRNTADFLASFAHYDPSRANGAGEYVLGPPMKTVSENAKTETTINPTWELTSFRFGLMTAIEWMRLSGQRANPKWGEVLTRLAKATVQNGVYLMQENMPETYTTMNYEHPALCGALGVLRGDGIDPAIARATMQKVHDVWQWDNVWGWDFPVMAMGAARNGLPEMAVEMLVKESPMNQYLVSGGNFQRPNVPAYYPGNGGLLLAIGMMAGGWERGGDKLAGFPRNGQWKVQAEGFGKWV